MSNQSGRSAIMSGFFTLCFSVIMMYILIAILQLPEKTGGIARIIFAGINCLIIIILAFFGNKIKYLTGFTVIVQLWFITVVYSIFQFTTVFIAIDTWHGNTYILYQIILVFIYLCVSLPIINISYKKTNIHSKEN